jgi:hypothetical protein
MAGKFGVKQSKRLDDVTLEKVSKKLFVVRGANFLWNDDLSTLCESLLISRAAFVRRANVSNLFVKIAFRLSEVSRIDVAGKAIIAFECSRCQSPYFEIKRDLLARGDITICGSCLRKQKCNTPERLAINSKAQKIAQNRPDVKSKMSASVKAAWKRDYNSRCESIRKAYRENPDYRDKLSKASLRMWRNDEFALKAESRSRSKMGNYKGLYYQSLCELAFLLWCEETGKSVRRFVGAIPYEYGGKIRSYRPDYVVDENAVVEVKHSLKHEEDMGRIKSVEAKYYSLKKYCKENNFFARLIEVSIDLPLQYKQARKVHNGKVTS